MGLVKAGAAAVVVVSASEVPGPTVNVNSGRGERTETRAQAVPWLEIGRSDGNEIMRGLCTEGQFYCSKEGWLNDLRISEYEYLPENAENTTAAEVLAELMAGPSCSSVSMLHVSFSYDENEYLKMYDWFMPVFGLTFIVPTLVVLHLCINLLQARLWTSSERPAHSAAGEDKSSCKRRELFYCMSPIARCLLRARRPTLTPPCRPFGNLLKRAASNTLPKVASKCTI